MIATNKEVIQEVFEAVAKAGDFMEKVQDLINSLQAYGVSSYSSFVAGGLLQPENLFVTNRN